MATSDATQRVAAAAMAAGLRIEIREYPDGTKTAQDAADAVGCALGEIVKSLVFLVDESPVIALVAGDNRLDTTKLATAAGGSKAGRASLEQVRAATGFVAGGTPPFGHATDVPVYADRTLRRFDRVWASGGTPNAVFAVGVDEVVAAAGATWADIAQS